MISKESKLKIEVAKSAYNTKTDKEISVLLNVLDVTVIGDINPDDLLVYLHRANLASLIKGRRGGNTNADKVLDNFMERALIKKPINPNHPVFQAGLSLLDEATGDSTLTNAQRIEIESLGNSLTSIGRELGYDHVWPRDIAGAR